MKLRNKQTGKIGYLYEHSLVQDTIIVYDVKGIVGKYNSLAELNANWEDVPEEPKEYWYLENNGEVVKTTYEGNLYEEKMQQIGNYFLSRKEAKLAVEKLKCFTNLKNHEFMFDGWYYGTDGDIVILANAHEFNDMEEQDLTKVFGEKIC